MGRTPYTAWTSVCLGPEMQSVFCSPLSTLGDQTRWGPWTPQEGFPGDHVWTPVVTAREQPRGHPGGPPWVPTRWINTGSPTACHPSRRLSIQLVPGDTLGCPPGCPLGGPQGGGGVLRSPGVPPEVPPQGVRCSPWSVGGPWGVQGVIKNKCSPDPSGSPKQTKNRRISIFPQERHAARDLASVLTEASRRLSIGHRISARFCKVGLGRSEAVFGDRG
jgi:hypothetical protein